MASDSINAEIRRARTVGGRHVDLISRYPAEASAAVWLLLAADWRSDEAWPRHGCGAISRAFAFRGRSSRVSRQYTEASRWRNEAAMKRYAIVIEKAQSNFAAYVPDLPGCVATGATVEETESLLRDAIALHIEGLREDGIEAPEPTSVVEYLELETIG